MKKLIGIILLAVLGFYAYSLYVKQQNEQAAEEAAKKKQQQQQEAALLNQFSSLLQ